MKMSFNNALQFQLYKLAHSKQLMLPASTVHCALPFGIVKCSVNLVGSTVAAQDLVLGRSENIEYRKSLCKIRLRFLEKTEPLYIQPIRLYSNPKCSIK